MNMSYCRYTNTLGDLRDCINDVVDHVNEEAKYPVSKSEIDCFRRMVKEFYQLLDFCCVINDDGTLNEEELDDVCFRMEQGYDVGDDEDDEEERWW